MKPIIYIFLGSALLAGGLKGWWISQDGIITSNDDGDWEALKTENQEGPARSILSKGIKESGILSGVNKDTKTSDLQNEGNLPALPEVIGTSVVNGRAQAHIRVENGPPLSYSKGDTLQSGWELVEVNLKGMVLVFEDTEFQLSLNEYDLTSPDNEQTNEPVPSEQATKKKAKKQSNPLFGRGN